VIKVGREAGLDVVIDNVAVSRHQMEIRLQDMKWVVRDLDSGNGTFLNGKRLWGSGPLKSGDEISFGKFSLFFDHGTRWCSAPTASRDRCGHTRSAAWPGAARHGGPASGWWRWRTSAGAPTTSRCS